MTTNTNNPGQDKNVTTPGGGQPTKPEQRDQKPEDRANAAGKPTDERNRGQNAPGAQSSMGGGAQSPNPREDRGSSNKPQTSGAGSMPGQSTPGRDAQSSDKSKNPARLDDEEGEENQNQKQGDKRANTAQGGAGDAPKSASAGSNKPS